MIDTVSNAPMTIDVTHSSMNAFLFIVQRLTKLFTAAVSSPAAAAPDWSPTEGRVYDDIQMAVTRQRLVMRDRLVSSLIHLGHHEQ